MYLAGLLNANNLFQRTAGWKENLGQGNEKDISAFLYRASSAVIHFQRIHDLNNTCIQEYDLFEDQLEVEDDRIVFQSVSLISLLNEISPLLSTIRIMQDSVLPLIGKTISQSFPLSMHTGIEKLHQYDLPKQIKDTLLAYWQSNGSTFRSYRSIDQHYHNLIEHIFFQVKPAKKVLVLFPDNPEKKSGSTFTYEKNIDGIAFLESSFSQLHTLTEEIAAILGFQPKPHNVEVNMSQLGELVPPRHRTLSLMVEKNFSRQTDNNVTLQISGLKMNQLIDMRLSFQKLELSEETIMELNRHPQPLTEQSSKNDQ